MKKNNIKRIASNEELGDLKEILEAVGLNVDEVSQETCLPDPELLMYYKNLSNREIWLDDSIDISTLEISKLIMHFNKMDSGLPVEERKPIKIYIYSYGGEVSACFNLVDTISLSKTPIYTYNMGVAMSAAFLILISGHKRFATKNSTALVHSGSGGTQGTYEQTEAQMKDYKHSVEVMREYVLTKTTIDPKKFAKNKGIDWYMYADEQLKNGAIDKILESVDDLWI